MVVDVRQLPVELGTGPSVKGNTSNVFFLPRDHLPIHNHTTRNSRETALLLLTILATSREEKTCFQP
jgi:hypothetical protein